MTHLTVFLFAMTTTRFRLVACISCMLWYNVENIYRFLSVLAARSNDDT